MKTLIMTTILLALTGCGFTSAGTAFQSTAREAGRQAMDAGVARATWFLCNAASVGAIQRRFGQSEAMANAWRALCKDATGIKVLGDSEN
jgi:hypothetical protein